MQMWSDGGLHGLRHLRSYLVGWKGRMMSEKLVD